MTDATLRGRSRAPELAALSEAALAVASDLEVESVLRTIVEAARTLAGARYAALGVPDEDGLFQQFVTAGVTDAQWKAIGPAPRGHGLLGVLLQRRTPYRTDDIRTDDRFEWWPAAHPVLTSFLGVPIVADDVVLGAIYVANKCDGASFTEDDEYLMTLLAAHAGIGLRHARLYERSRELTIIEERTRIARELHDAVAQKLFSLRLTAEAAATVATRDPARAAEQVARVAELSGSALRELRSVIDALRPAELVDDGLVATLAKHVDVLDRVHTARVRLDAGILPRLSADVEDAVLRIAQEAMHNALRHGDPSMVTVRLSQVGSTLVLEVIDDGTGFDVEAASRASRRLGLVSMRDRAAGVGGSFSVWSEPGSGTQVRLEVPDA
ncbi:MAG TPA: GAF domain-containing sensor histidine kinase [Actinomycetes bacterium]|nr:GAF domain-containing sensor histidine kinase [Actinomycetes bacterium]